MATHSSILAWKIHGQRSLAGNSPWGRKELDTTELWRECAQANTHTHTHKYTRNFRRCLEVHKHLNIPRVKKDALEKEMATHSSVLAWRIPGTGEPGGLPPMGSHRVGHD